MKRLIFLLLISFIALGAYASSHNNDSTVHIIANWQSGDKALYEYRSQEMTIKGNDTLFTEPIYVERFSFEIVSASTEEYTIKYTLLDCKRITSNNGVEKEIDMLLWGLPKGTTAIFHTNGIGKLKEVINWNIPKSGNKNVPKQVVILNDNNLGNGLTVINEDPIEVNEDPLEKIPHIIELFNYYGVTLEKDSTYSWKDKTLSKWNDELIDVHCEIYAFQDIEEKELIHIVNNNKPDSKQLTENHRAHFSNLDINPMLLAQLPNLSTEYNRHITFHHPSGWIVEFLNERCTTMGKDTTLSIKEIRVLFDDETSFYQK